MNRNQSAGIKKVVKGGVKEATSTLTDNKAGQLEGKVEKTMGKVQTRVGNEQAKARVKQTGPV